MKSRLYSALCPGVHVPLAERSCFHGNPTGCSRLQGPCDPNRILDFTLHSCFPCVSPLPSFILLHLILSPVNDSHMLQEGKERPSACETFAAGLREKKHWSQQCTGWFCGLGYAVEFTGFSVTNHDDLCPGLSISRSWNGKIQNEVKNDNVSFVCTCWLII